MSNSQHVSPFLVQYVSQIPCQFEAYIVIQELQKHLKIHLVSYMDDTKHGFCHECNQSVKQYKELYRIM